MLEAFCSWSGGKDCCISLYLALQQEIRVSTLFTVMIPKIKRSRSHGIRQEILEKQAELMGLKWKCRSASWDAYKTEFLNGLKLLAGQGIKAGIFGDIDINSHQQWNIDVCSHYGMKAIHPIWKHDREKIVETFLNNGFKAYIVCVRNGQLDPSFVGREFSEETIEDLKKEKIDLCGENGEFHTLVVDGPLFLRPLDISFGPPQLREGMWVTDVFSECTT